MGKALECGQSLEAQMTTPTDYPIPDSAAYIWSNGEKIVITFPGYRGLNDRRFNSTTLDPKDPASLFVLWSILRERCKATAEERKIASRATPTQYNIDEMIKAMKVKRIEPKKAYDNSISAEDFINSLGELDMSDLEEIAR